MDAKNEQLSFNLEHNDAQRGESVNSRTTMGETIVVDEDTTRSTSLPHESEGAVLNSEQVENLTDAGVGPAESTEASLPLAQTVQAQANLEAAAATEAVRSSRRLELKEIELPSKSREGEEVRISCSPRMTALEKEKLAVKQLCENSPEESGMLSDDEDGDESDDEDDDYSTSAYSRVCCCRCFRRWPMCHFFIAHKFATLGFFLGLVLILIGSLLEYGAFGELNSRQALVAAYVVTFLGGIFITFLLSHAVLHLVQSIISSALNKSQSKKTRHILSTINYYITGLNHILPFVLWMLLLMLTWAIMRTFVTYFSVQSNLHKTSDTAQLTFILAELNDTAFAIILVLLLLMLAFMLARFARMYIIQDFGTRSYQARVNKTISCEYLLCNVLGSRNRIFSGIIASLGHVNDDGQGNSINPELWQTICRYVDTHHVDGIEVSEGKFKPLQPGVQPDFKRHSAPVARAIFSRLYAMVLQHRTLKAASNTTPGRSEGPEEKDIGFSEQAAEQRSLDSNGFSVGSKGLGNIMDPLSSNREMLTPDMLNKSKREMRSRKEIRGARKTAAAADRRVIYKQEFFDILTAMEVNRGDILQQLWDEWLDPDATGYVRPARCKRAIEAMYRDRFSISVTMQDAQTVLSSMENTFLAFFLFLVVVICVALYSGTSNFTQGFATIATLTVAWSFVFGPSMARSFEGLIFLFSIHLYDVGDTLLFPDGDYYTVNRIRVLTTDFLRDDGSFVRLENSALRAKEIVNLSTSKQKNQLLDFYVHSYDMTPELMQSMTDDLDAFVKENPADYSSYHITVRNFVHSAAQGGRGDNGNFCRVAVWLCFNKLNIEIRACHYARQNFLLYLCKIMRKNGIEPPSQTNLNKAKTQHHS